MQSKMENLKLRKENLLHFKRTKIPAYEKEEVQALNFDKQSTKDFTFHYPYALSQMVHPSGVDLH